MKPFTIWVRKPATIMIGGEADKPIPIITGTLVNPQVIIDPIKGEIIITETK